VGIEVAMIDPYPHDGLSGDQIIQIFKA